VSTICNVVPRAGGSASSEPDPDGWVGQARIDAFDVERGCAPGFLAEVTRHPTP